MAASARVGYRGFRPSVASSSPKSSAWRSTSAVRAATDAGASPVALAAPTPSPRCCCSAPPAPAGPERGVAALAPPGPLARATCLRRELPPEGGELPFKGVGNSPDAKKIRHAVGETL